ncbi:MAG: NAD(P)H-dependent oxidoreductase [Reichenbachiella sp.]
MKKIVAFGASNSSTSINQKLAEWTANQIGDTEVKVLNLNDFEAPIFSTDRENQDGIPKAIQNFKNEINEADGLVISLAEHNGNFTTAFKNIYDWMSRMDRSVWNDIPMFLMSSSPGPGGGAGVLNLAQKGFNYAGGNIVASFSLPSFYQNFSPEGISNDDIADSFKEQLDLFQQKIIDNEENVQEVASA